MIRRLSEKRRRESDGVREAKEVFVAERNCCVPWCLRQAEECHEIARGANRGRAALDRAAWLAVCRAHHVEFDDYSRWGLPRQYALKAVSDMEFYDRVRLNLIRGKAQDSIDERQVLSRVVELLTRVA